MRYKSLAHRIFTEKRRLILAVGILLLVNLAIYLVAVYPQDRRVASAAARAEAAGLAVESARQNEIDVRARIEGKGQADAQLTRFYSEVLPSDLAGARRITYLRLAQLAEESGLRYERRTIRTEQEDDSRLAVLRMTMVLQGEYGDVRRFIYALETAPEFVVIESVALAQGEEQDAPLVLTIQAATYYPAADDDT